MKSYEKPVAVNTGINEGVYAASGEKERCRFGRTEYNPGSDKCQSCSATNGENDTGKRPDGTSYRKEDFTTCPDNMPSSK